MNGGWPLGRLGVNGGWPLGRLRVNGGWSFDRLGVNGGRLVGKVRGAKGLKHLGDSSPLAQNDSVVNCYKELK